MSEGYCDQCRHYLAIPRTGRGRCFFLEGEAVEGLVHTLSILDCKVEVSVHGSRDACAEFQSTLPDDLMAFIQDNDREEQRWNP